MERVQLPLGVRAMARRVRLEREQRGEEEASREGPFLVMPAMDPPLVPPDDVSLIEREAEAVESTAVGSEGLREAMEAFNRQTGRA